MQASTAASADRGRLDFGIAGRIAVLFGMAVSSYGLLGFAPVLPFIAAAFPDEPNAALLTRLMVSAAGIFVGVLSPIVGSVADRVGSRRVMLAALLLYAVAGCAPFFLNNLYAIIVARIFHGIAVAAYGTVVLVMLVKHSTGNARDRWLGYLVMAATIFSIIHGPMVGYIGHEFGWRAVFLTYAIALPFFALVFVGFPPDGAHESAGPAAAQAAVPDDFRPIDQVKFAVFALLCGGVLMAGPVFLPFRLREIGLANSQVIGNMMMTVAVAGVAAGYAYGLVRARVSVYATFIISFSIMTVGTILIATVSGTYEMIAAMFIAGFGQGLSIPNYWSFAAASAPERYRARFVGLAKSGVYAGPLIAQLVLEPAVARSNYATAFGGLAVASVAFALYFMWRRQAQSVTGTPATAAAHD